MWIRASSSTWLALGAFLAGCGDGTGPAAVTVSTVDGPAAGVDVVFHDSTGQPISHVTTDATGRASAEVDEDAMITVLFLDGEDRYRATFLGVQPDDELTFVAPRVEAQVVGTAYVTIGEGYPGAVTYVLENACSSVFTGDVSQPIPIEVRTTCLSPDGTFHLLVSALDVDGAIMARASLRDLEWVDPMNVTMPAWGGMATLAVQGTNLPSGALGVVLQVGYDANGVFFSGPSEGALIDPGQGATLTVQYAPDFADYLQTQIGVMFGPSTDALDGAAMIIERHATPIASRTVDLTDDFLPRISLPAYDQTDPARPTMSWTADRSLAATDGGAVLFAWSESQGPRQEWGMLVPPDVVSPVQVPALPAELASWAPAAGADYETGTIWFVDADWVSSYDELRTGVGVGFVFGDGNDVFPDSDALVKVTMSGDL